MPTIWVADLRISDATAHKISTKHGLSADEVRSAIQCVTGLDFAWDDDPTRGLRAIIVARIREFKVYVVLYPRVDDAYGDSWNLGSAYQVPE